MTMLSRVADSLYWMSRYIERAEHTCRLVEVNLKQMLDESPEVAGRRWERVVSCLRTDPPTQGEREAAAVTSWVMYDLANPDSIASCVAAARENARQVREVINTEIWEGINRLHLFVKKAINDPAQRRDPHEFLRRLKSDIHLIHGVADSSIVRGEGWLFLQVGRSVERSAATTALLIEHAQDFLEPDMGGSAAGFLHWVGVLRSCTAFEAYTKTYTAEVRPARVLEFLLLNQEFPRSVAFCIHHLRDCLERIESIQGLPRAVRAVKLSRKLEGLLDFLSVEDLMDGTLLTKMRDIEELCSGIHAAIEESYVFYESALGEIRETA